MTYVATSGAFDDPYVQRMRIYLEPRPVMRLGDQVGSPQG